MTIGRRVWSTLRSRLHEELGSPRGRASLVLAVVAAIGAISWTIAASASGATTGTGTGLVLAVAAAALAVVTALALLDPWSGLLCWIVLMPVMNAARVALPVGDILSTQTSIILLAIVVGIVLTCWRGRERPRPIPRAAMAVAGAAIALALISGSAARDSATGLTIALHGVVEPAVVALLGMGLLTGAGRVWALAVAMVASVFLATVYNLERLVRITFDLAIAQSDRTGFARFTYYNVGIFGDMLVMTLPLAVILLVDARRRGSSRRTTWVWASAVTTLVLGLYLTFTKGPWLAGLVSIAVLLLMINVTRRRRIAVVVGALILAVPIIPYPGYVLRAFDPVPADRLLSLVATFQGGNRANSWDPETVEGEVSIRERYLATVAALEMARDHPLLGVGPGSFGAAYQGGYRRAGATRDLGSAHDMVPDIAAEFGLPLAAIIVAWIDGVLLAAWRLLRRRRPSDSLAVLGFAAGFGAFLVVGVTFGVDLYRPWRVMSSDVVFAALLAAGIIALSRLPGRSEPGVSQLDRRSLTV